MLNAASRIGFLTLSFIYCSCKPVQVSINKKGEMEG